MHEKSVELLNKAVADELSAVHQYMYFHFLGQVPATYRVRCLNNILKTFPFHAGGRLGVRAYICTVMHYGITAYTAVGAP